MPASRDRVAGFTTTLETTYGVALLSSPEAVAEVCDALLITAVDGRTHPEIYGRVAGGSRPTFIDKPVAVSCEGLAAICATAERVQGRWFSSSALRFLPAVQALRERCRAEPAITLEIAGPVYWEPTNPGYFWYGIHLVETLCALRGPATRRVKVQAAAGEEWVEMEHADGRADRLRVLPTEASFCAYLGTGDNRVGPINLGAPLVEYLRPLVGAMLPFFCDAPAPVEVAETWHVLRCIEAINRSRTTGAWTDV